MNMEMTLCRPCAEKLKRGYKVQELKGKTEKITCAECRCRRYGLKYKVEEKL